MKGKYTFPFWKFSLVRSFSEVSEKWPDKCSVWVLRKFKWMVIGQKRPVMIGDDQTLFSALIFTTKSIATSSSHAKITFLIKQTVSGSINQKSSYRSSDREWNTIFQRYGTNMSYTRWMGCWPVCQNKSHRFKIGWREKYITSWVPTGVQDPRTEIRSPPPKNNLSLQVPKHLGRSTLHYKLCNIHDEPLIMLLFAWSVS